MQMFSEQSSGMHPHIEQLITNSADVADIIVAEYHSGGLLRDDHVDHVNSCIAGRTPALVVVLTCWTHPVEQTSAMQSLAVVHPGTIFITYRDPQVRYLPKFNIAILHLNDHILYPRCKVPFHFLGLLCSSQRDLLMFTACDSQHPSSTGPLRVMVRDHSTITSTPSCDGCGVYYHDSQRWRKGVDGVRRRRCNRTAQCVHLLVVSKAAENVEPSSHLTAGGVHC